MSKKVLNIYKKLSSASLLVMALNSNVIAQTTEVDNDIPTSQRLLEEVTIYGAKRSVTESAQSIPGQVAAFDSSQLEARQVITLEDLTMSIPNVQLDDARTSLGVANFTIRGQGINSSIPSIDPTVGIFVDGIYQGTTYGVVTDMFGLESVEVHKGPQGVLFGRNVTAGAVLLRSARPNGETEIKGKIGIETGLQYIIAASAEGALVEDKIAAKVSIQYKDDNGYFKNPTIGRDVGKGNTLVIRPIVVFTPNSNFDATVIWDHGEMSGDGGAAQVSDGFTSLNPSNVIETVIDNPGFIDLSWDQITMEMNWIVGEGRITNILGYRNISNSAGIDVDSTALNFFNLELDVQQDQISNELRYNGVIIDGWELTTGLYYYKADLEYQEGRAINFDAIRIGGGGLQNHKTLGAFVNNYFNLSDELTLQAGLRYSYEKKDVIIHPLGSCTFEQVCGDGNEDDKKWTNWSPKIGLKWVVNEDVSAYGHFARSYRAGGYNFRSPLPDPNPFDPERVDSFELGVKSKLMDNRVRFNAAIFFNKLDNMQREINLTDPDIGVFQDISNTASAEVLGIEADTVALITDTFAIHASVGYLDSKYTEIFIDLSGDGIIDQTDFDLRLPRLAKWTVNIGFNYDIEMEMGTLTARADYGYRSGAAMTDRNNAIFNSYVMVDAGLTYKPSDGNWSLSVYGKNLKNTALLTAVTALPLSFGSTYFAPLSKGRRYGAELRFEF